MKLSFKPHLKFSGKRAVALARILPHVSGPKQTLQLLLWTVISSVLSFHVSPVQASARNSVANRRQLQAAYALRTYRAYQTTSYKEGCVIVGTIPVYISTDETNDLYEKQEARLSILLV